MSPSNEPLPDPPPIDKFHELEIVKVFDAILASNQTRTQMIALFSTLNVAVVTLAFSTERAGLLVFGALVWMLGLLNEQVQRELAIRLYYRAYVLERRYAAQEPYTFLTSYFRGTVAPDLPAVDPSVTAAEQVRALRRIARRRILVPGTLLVLALVLLELALGLYLMFGAGWHAF